MKPWFLRNRLLLVGALAGALVGFFYWKYAGCTNGTCLITGKPLNSTVYFSMMGALAFGLFKKNPVRDDNSGNK